MRARLGVLLLLGFAGVVAVVLGIGDPVDPSAPPDITYGVDACSRCRMTISDERFASGYRLANGEVRVFDDVGEMALYKAEHGESPKHEWVRDYESGRWLDARGAHYVHAAELHSPMGYNLAAFAEEESAKRAANELGGEVLRWSDLPVSPQGHHH